VCYLNYYSYIHQPQKFALKNCNFSSSMSLWILEYFGFSDWECLATSLLSCSKIRKVQNVKMWNTFNPKHFGKGIFNLLLNCSQIGNVLFLWLCSRGFFMGFFVVGFLCVCVWNWGFELRVFYLLSKCSITWVSFQSFPFIFCF
jgi:hypothetical protein